MDNPLFTGPTKGYFSAMSNKNRKDDLDRIKDSRANPRPIKKNSCRFPSQVYVINLDRREDRWADFIKLNQESLSGFQINRFSALEKSSPVDGIFASFLSCLEQNLAEEETIIIMEDDAYLVPGAIEKIRLAFADLPEDWDCLIGNHYFISQIELLTDHLGKPLGIASTLNFGIFRNTIVNKIHEDYNKRQTLPGLNDFDHFLTSPTTSIQNYTIWPMIAREFLSVSDHYQKVRNMEFRIRENAFLYQFIDSDTYYSNLENW
jgi:GR25 family glycosyltransferase involved in LPS biosynthesis